MNSLRTIFLIFLGSLCLSFASGQGVPYDPASYPIFSPQLFNPGIVGSKDVTKANLLFKANGSPGAQLLTYNSRLNKSLFGSAAAEGSPFSNIGVGGYIFHDMLIDSRNMGAGVSAAYHIPLGEEKISGVSIGASFKGVYNMVTEEGEVAGAGPNKLSPNADVGIYYYGSMGFAGISATNLLSIKADSLVNTGSEGYLTSMQHLHGGFKFLLSRKRSIVLEPSVLISINDFSFTDIAQQITPYLKIYIENFYMGTYFKDTDHLSMFFQYELPRLYGGVFVEFPRNQLLNSEVLTIELSLGLKLGSNTSPDEFFTAYGVESVNDEINSSRIDEKANTPEANASDEVKKNRGKAELNDAKGGVNEIKKSKKEARLAKKVEPTTTQEELTRTEGLSNKDALAAQKEEEEALAKKAKEEALAAKKVEEEALLAKKAEEEALAKKAEEEALLAKRAEEEALLAKKAEEQALLAKNAEEEALLAKKAIEEAEENTPFFRVQITSSSKAKSNYTVEINGKSYPTFEYYYKGAYRYTVGDFRTVKEAITFKNKCRESGFNQAFVAAFINDVRETDPAVFKQ